MPAQPRPGLRVETGVNPRGAANFHSINAWVDHGKFKRLKPVGYS